MIWQITFAPGWWKQMSLLVFFACLKVRTRTYKCHLSMPSPPWQNLVSSYIISYCARTYDPADDFRSKIIETDGLPLVGPDIYQSFIDVIVALARFGRLIYYLYCARTDDPVDDFRSKMVETDVLTRLCALFERQDSVVQRSFVSAITTLAEFGGFLCNFTILCTD